MAITWGTLKSLMLQQMDAADVDTSLDRTPQMQWAMRTFCQHTPYYGTQQYTVTASSEALDLPSDFLDPHGVFYTGATKKGWGDHFGLGMGAEGIATGSTFTSIGWWIWPQNKLNVLNMIGTVDLYYYAYYPDIDDDDEDQEIPIPDWSVHPLIWLAIVYAKIPFSVLTSDLAAWAESAGERGQNPVLEQIDYFQKQYAWELALHPAVERVIITPGGTYGR